ncbi:MAG: TIGR04150 pseudo-rSAM protein [Lentimicrobiaceae bacterium]|nr:TIGR04150 pseudo-rSAM protein [Lentimicrobiaceae bacterium]
MKKYRLVLSEDTFLWIKNHEGLVYQSKKYRAFVFSLSEKLSEICSHLFVLEHLYTIDLTEKELKNSDVRHFVDQLIEIDAGRLIPNTSTKKGTVSLMPVLKIHEEISDYIKKHKRGVGGNIIEHIHELTFYLNGSKYGNDLYYRQTIFPTKHESVLETEKIIRFIRNSKNPFLFNINLVGNIFSFPYFEELLHHIETFEIPVTICITGSDAFENKDLLKKNDWRKFRIIADKKDNIERTIAFFEEIGISFSVDFIIFSEQDYLDVEKFSTTMDGNFVPMCNGENIEFFESNIFISEKEILSSALSKRQIFQRQATNVNHFGKLTILPDGNVYADANQTSLGTIGDTVYSIVYREFTEGKSWFRVRNFTPCKDCIYQWLCPSPSNYETVIGRSNLCCVKP